SGARTTIDCREPALARSGHRADPPMSRHHSQREATGPRALPGDRAFAYAGAVHGAVAQSATIAHAPAKALDRRAPDHRNVAIAVAGFLDMGERREGVMETLHAHLVCDQHVVDLAARRFGHDRILIIERMPIRVAHEQE